MSLSLRVLSLLRRLPHPRTPRRRRGLAAVAPACAALALAAPVLAGISGVAVTPTVFSPNGDGVLDSTVVRWTASGAPESLRVEVRRAGQGFGVPPLRALAFGPQAAGPGQAIWDGRDTTGAVTVDGTYVVRVVELTALGGPVAGGEGVAAVSVDVTAPPVPRFYDDAPRDTTEAELTIGGYAPGADSVVVYVGGAPSFAIRVPAPDSVFEAEVPGIEGPNAIALESVDRAGNRSGLSAALTITYRNTAEITELRATPFESSPNGDGFLDSTFAVVEIDAPTTRLRVDVRPANPPLNGTVFADTAWIATLFDGPAAAGEFTFAWDGKDSTGAEMPGGNWWFFAQAESADALGQPQPGTPRHVRFQIDRSVPPIPFPSPAPPARTTRGTITLTGSSPEADTVRVWRGATLVGRGAATPNWTINVPLVLGPNLLTFDASERSGLVSARGSAVTVVYEEPLGLHAPERFTAGSAFDVNLSRTAESVRIDLYELGGRRVRTLTATQAAQSYELTWDLLDERGVRVGDGPYVARVTVSYAGGGSETKSGAVVVAK